PRGGGRRLGAPLMLSNGLVRAALALGVFVGAGQLAAADVAQQLFDDGQLATARRGGVGVHGQLFAVLQTQDAHARHHAVVLVEDDLGDAALGHLGAVVGVFLGGLADVVPDVVLEGGA